MPFIRRYGPWVGVVAAVVVAWTTAAADDPVAVANVALILAAVTIAAAVVDWRAGLATSFAAAFALNYFHTEPVGSFRMSDGDDVVSVILLTAIGLGVTLASAARSRTREREHAAAMARSARAFLDACSGVDVPVDAVWQHATHASCGQLALVDCRVDDPGASLPVVARLQAPIDGDTHFVLPPSGAMVEFKDPRRRQTVVMTPRPGQGSVVLDRRVVMAFVDQLALALEQPVPET